MRRQCELLGLARSSCYYEAVPESDENLRLLRRLDGQYLKTPFYGSRRMAWWLGTQGIEANLKRVQRLYCKNERAVIHATLDHGGHSIALVPVAAILVASIRLHFLDVLLHLRWPGPNEIPCDAAVHKGQELGWFEHGSTIIVFAPPGFTLAPGIEPGRALRMGQPLMCLPVSAC